MSLFGEMFGDCGYGCLGTDDPTFRPAAAMQREQEQRTYTDAGTIRTVQQILAMKGYDPGPIDGVYGPRTSEALLFFNEARGITKAGPPDDETLAALGLTHAGETRIVAIEEGSTITGDPRSSSGTIGILALAAGAALLAWK